MGANKYEVFETEVVNRSQVSEAEYNPRKISKEAKKRLQLFLKKNGLWQPLIMNRRTGRLVSGHQRMGILDTLMPSGDYDMTMAVVDVDEKTEVSGNVFMNNPSSMGEWDFDILRQLSDTFETIDFEKDFGFDPAELSIFMPEAENTFIGYADSIDPPAKSTTDTAEGEPDLLSTDDHRTTIRDLQRKNRETASSKIQDGRDYYMHDADFSVSVIFGSAKEKRAFMRALNQPEWEKRMVFHDLRQFVTIELPE